MEPPVVVKQAFGLRRVTPGDVDADQLAPPVDDSDTLDHRMPDDDMVRVMAIEDRLQGGIVGPATPVFGMLREVPPVPMRPLLMPDQTGAKIGPRLGSNSRVAWV